MKRRRNQPASPLSSLDSQDELSEEELDDELDDEVNPDIDELDDEMEDEEEDEVDEDDDLNDLSEESPEVQSPLPERIKKRRGAKRKKPLYEEPNSEEDEDEDEEEDEDIQEQEEEEIEEEEEEEEEDDDLEVVSNRPLTKRQRAKLNNEGPEEFLELPMDTGKKKNILTEEEQTLRRSEVARRRKNQSIQRAEKDKEDTINRLLKKQASKSRKVIKDDANDEKEGKASRRSMPPDTISYVNNTNGSLLTIPSAVTVHEIFGHPPQQQSSDTPPAPQLCQVSGCNASKKYVEMKSGKAVCSLEHYKQVQVETQ